MRNLTCPKMKKYSFPPPSRVESQSKKLLPHTVAKPVASRSGQTCCQALWPNLLPNPTDRALWNGGRGPPISTFVCDHAPRSRRLRTAPFEAMLLAGAADSDERQPQACPEASSVSPRAGLPTTSTDAALAAVVAATADGWLAVDASASRQVEVLAPPQSPHHRLPLPRVACQLSPPSGQLLQT